MVGLSFVLYCSAHMEILKLPVIQIVWFKIICCVLGVCWGGASGWTDSKLTCNDYVHADWYGWNIICSCE